MPSPEKSAGAFRTIGEVSRDAGIPQHILRYWETRFPQLRPVQRAGRRRYYRPEDVALVLRIKRLLDDEGYTIRGVQKLLEAEAPRRGPPRKGQLMAIRDRLATALVRDDRSGR